MITSLFSGPTTESMVPVGRLPRYNGGKMAHCDVLSINPFLSFELEEASYQNALKRSQEHPELAQRVRASHEANEVTFRGMFNSSLVSSSAAASPPSATSSVETRLARMENELATFRKATDEKIESTRDVTFRAVRGVCEDINESLGEKTYAGRMLRLLDGKEEDADVEFRGVGESDDESDSSDSSDDGF